MLWQCFDKVVTIVYKNINSACHVLWSLISCARRSYRSWDSSEFFFESSPSDFGFESRKANQARTMSKTCQPSVFTIFLEIPGLETDRWRKTMQNIPARQSCGIALPQPIGILFRNRILRVFVCVGFILTFCSHADTGKKWCVVPLEGWTRVIRAWIADPNGFVIDGVSMWLWRGFDLVLQVCSWQLAGEG